MHDNKDYGDKEVMLIAENKIIERYLRRNDVEIGGTVLWLFRGCQLSTSLLSAIRDTTADTLNQEMKEEIINYWKKSKTASFSSLN